MSLVVSSKEKESFDKSGVRSLLLEHLKQSSSYLDMLRDRLLALPYSEARERAGLRFLSNIEEVLILQNSPIHTLIYQFFVLK